MRGLGADLASPLESAVQVGESGSAFLNGVLTPGETRRVHTHVAATSDAHPSPTRYDEAVARRVGGLWATEGAFIRAWSCALFGSPLLIDTDDVDWHEIEVSHSEWNRPALILHGRIVAACRGSLGMSFAWGALMPISHDGEYAIVQVAIVDVSD